MYIQVYIGRVYTSSGTTELLPQSPYVCGFYVYYERVSMMGKHIGEIYFHNVILHLMRDIITF